ncbi:MAG TPA: acetyl-CoA sensor PanZ family protein, partial [Pseudomonadales bacterium]|nr:acetyl-CoA sensor PanZ family protein [Pseudomonadales bacterium]
HSPESTMPVLLEQLVTPSAQDVADLIKIYHDDPGFAGQDEARIQRFVEERLQTHSLYGGRFNGRLLAAMVVDRQSTPWRMELLCVRSLTRRRGVARRMMELIEAEAATAGQGLIATIPTGDATLLQLARKAGFHVKQVMPPATIEIEWSPLRIA